MLNPPLTKAESVCVWGGEGLIICIVVIFVQKMISGHHRCDRIICAVVSIIDIGLVLGLLFSYLSLSNELCGDRAIAYVLGHTGNRSSFMHRATSRLCTMSRWLS